MLTYLWAIRTGPVSLTAAATALYPLLTISKITPQTTTGVLTMRASVHNQDSVLVFEGEHKYLIRRRKSDTSA